MELSWTLQPVSEMNVSQLDELTLLVNLANRAYPRIFPGDRLGPKSIEEQYADTSALICRNSTEALGCVLVKPDGDSLWLYLLAVNATVQHIGLGSALLRKAEEVAIKEKLSYLRLEAVDSGNLVGFYRRLGFEVFDEKICPPGQWGAPHEFRLVGLKKRITQED